MKQFTRCTNCRQWYLHTFTAVVETRHAERLRRVTVWCLRCIDEAEQRSHPIALSEPVTHQEDLPQSLASAPTADASAARPGAAHLIQEHMALMERALHDDDDVLIPIIQDFMRRCRDHQQQSETTEATQRLDRHLHYWETFMRVLHQAS